MLESVALTNPHHPERVAPSRLRRLTPRLAAHDAGGVTGGGSRGHARSSAVCVRSGRDAFGLSWAQDRLAGRRFPP